MRQPRTTSAAIRSAGVTRKATGGGTHRSPVATRRVAPATRRGPSLGCGRLGLPLLVVLLTLTTAAIASPAVAARTAPPSGLPADAFGAPSDPLAALSGASSTTPGAGVPAPTRYEQAVLADHPTLYLPLTESSGATAFDRSGNGLDGTYDLGVSHEDTGPLLGEENFAAYGNSQVVSQSGDKLPLGAAARTLELWVHNTGTQSLTLAQYGDIEGGHGFAVTIHQQTLTVEASAHAVSVSTVDGFGHWCCDATGWHMVDVTYDGEQVEIYQDGQLLGGGALGNAETAVPGQGLRLNASYTGCGCGNTVPYGLAEAAIYPAALTPEQIGAHWSAGASTGEQAQCAPAPTGAYPSSVLEDSPIVYYRAGESGAYPKDRVAFDSSGHCDNATFDLGTGAGGGALAGDTDPAIFGNGQVIFQSGDRLPAEAEPRTLEFWVHNTGTQSLTLAQYGDIEGGHGFAVTIHQQTLTVEGETGHSVSANTIDGFGHWCCDATGWHMVDVTYDGMTVDIYQDGQLIGSGAFGQTATTVPGQGLRLNASYTGCGCGNAAPYGLDEAAVYGSALSSARIVAHWEAAPRPPDGYAVIAGTATNGGGGRVQACPTSGAACTVDRYGIDTSGAFHLLVPDGAYTVTFFPPAGSAGGPKTIGPVTVPPSDFNLHVAFPVPGGLPENVSLSSPGRGTQENTVPGLNWGEPFTVHAAGCQNGVGVAYVAGTNSSTGVTETRASVLAERPNGSGQYAGQFGPLAPIHGLGSVDPQIACPEQTSIAPDGGAPGGGTQVIFVGKGFTGATAVTFGATPAISFTVESDEVIVAESPPGAGSVTVNVTTPRGAVDVGTFDYFDVTSVSPQTGPAQGGNTVTIHGSGFTNVKAVGFGIMPSQSFKVVSPGEIQAEAPAGLGTINVVVLNGLAESDASPATQYTYQGGPAGSASIVEPIGGGDGAASTYAAGVANYCAQQNCSALGFGPLSSSAGEWNTPVQGDSGAPEGLSFDDWFGIGSTAVGTVVGFLCLATPAAPACAAAATILAGVAIGTTIHLLLTHLCPRGGGGLCSLFVDPSGTIVDTHGNPLSGATATLLEQPALGAAFTPVEPSSAAIEPAENPQTTKASGQFDWNALAGVYEVEASAPGCHAPGEPGQASVFTNPFAIPPAVVGLMLTLECASAPAPTPKVTSLSASGGAAGGGDVVDISGEGLAGVTAVHFGNNASVHVQPLSPYAVAAIAPAGAGTVDVTVSGPGGSSATSAADRYTYSTPVVTANSPAVELVTPNTGPVSGGTAVTIKGVHLSGAFAVQFGGALATQVVAKSESEVQAVAPASAFPERINVTVTTSTGSSAPTLADSFSYGSPPPPRATNVTLTPSEGVLAHGQTLTLRATVSPSDGGGSVAFYADGSNTPLGNCGAQALTLGGADHVATCSTSTLAVGQHTLSASYSGDASYAKSSGAANVSVGFSAEEEAQLKAEREAQEATARGHAQEEAEARRHPQEEAAASRPRVEGPRSEVLGGKSSRARPATRAQLLAKALKACRKSPTKTKRSVCEKRARRRYDGRRRVKRRRGRKN